MLIAQPFSFCEFGSIRYFKIFPISLHNPQTKNILKRFVKKPTHISSETQTLIIFNGNLLNPYGSLKYY